MGRWVAGMRSPMVMAGSFPVLKIPLCSCAAERLAVKPKVTAPAAGSVMSLLLAGGEPWS